MKLIFSLIFLVFVASNALVAQSNKTATQLKQEINNTTDELKKAEYICDLATELAKVNPIADSVLILANQSVEIAKNLGSRSL